MTDRARDDPQPDHDQGQAYELNPARDNQLRRPSRHVTDGTAAPRGTLSPDWGWAAYEDGALALGRHDLWTDPGPPGRVRPPGAKVPHDLKQQASSVTVRRMRQQTTAYPRTGSRARRADARRRHARRHEHRLRRFALLTSSRS